MKSNKWNPTKQVKAGYLDKVNARCCICGQVRPTYKMRSIEPDHPNPLLFAVEFRCRNGNECKAYIEHRQK